MEKPDRISPEEFKAQFGSRSSFFINFKDIFLRNFDHFSMKTAYISWKNDFGYLSQHLNSAKLQKDFFLRVSYVIWIFLQIGRQLDKSFGFKDYLPFNFKPFQFLFTLSFISERTSSESLPQKVLPYQNFKDEDMFADFLSDILSLETLEEKGMFFTPNYLAKCLIEQILKRDSSHLLKTPLIDPTCGTGAFLQESFKTFFPHASTYSHFTPFYQEIYGIDENPAALLATILNLWILIVKKYGPIKEKEELYSFFQKNFICTDLLTLLGNPKQISHFPRFSTACGNLPWNVLNNIRTASLREQLLKLANFYQIRMTWKNQSNIEIATIFWEIIRTKLVIQGGIMAFLLPTSLLTGSQHAKFRRFSGLQEIQAFQIYPDFFPVHSMILICEVENSNILESEEDHSQFSPKYVQANKIVFQNFIERKNHMKSNPSYHVNRIGSFAPSSFKIYRNQPLVSKYDFEPKYHLQLPISPSDYASCVHRGVDITPRQLLFVQSSLHLSHFSAKSQASRSIELKEFKESKETKETKITKILINPVIQRFSSTHSKRWNKVTFAPTQVESNFIHPIIKSTDLIPFSVQAFHEAFLPIQLEDDKYIILDENQLPLLARHHFRNISQLYLKYRNPKGRNKTISDSLGYGQKISNLALTSTLKVIYPVGGSYTKAAIIRNPNWIIDVTFYYLTPDNENEAYYLLAWLNSEILNRNLPRVCTVGANGSIRVIHKAPWQFPLPKFGSHPLTYKISHMGKKMEQRAFEIYKNNEIDTKIRRNPSSNCVSLTKIYKLLKNDEEYQILQLQLGNLLNELITLP
ncbi:MAG: hypothetical protein DRO88_00770 [Promethearchaeia archaeon]|nr:MAG: hypothetical protein DRO88_00770 [Candidatus Lokiarchaeia archaeon]